MPANRPTPPEADLHSDQGAGLEDPRTIYPGPEVVQPASVDPQEVGGTPPAPSPRPDATDDTEPEATGLIDPRSEIPDPLGP